MSNWQSLFHVMDLKLDVESSLTPQRLSAATAPNWWSVVMNILCSIFSQILWVGQIAKLNTHENSVCPSKGW